MAVFRWKGSEYTFCFMVKNKIPIEWNLLLIIKIAPGR